MRRGEHPARVGERVWFYEAQWGSPLGSAAELVALPAARAVENEQEPRRSERNAIGNALFRIVQPRDPMLRIERRGKRHCPNQDQNEGKKAT